MYLKSKTYKDCFLFLALLVFLFFSGCKDDDEIPPQHDTIVYKTDGRSVKLGDPLPIALDLSEDGLIDFTIFVELTANSQGDRLYVGMNPIGDNLMKSGPSIEDNYLSMGLVIAELPESTIDFDVEANQHWTSAHGALVIRNTSTKGEISYEGNWADSEQVAGIQNVFDGNVHFGWLRIEFDKMTETVTLIDYAYSSVANQPIVAGADSN